MKKDKIDKGFTLISVMAVVVALANIAVIGAIIYVIYHFLSKIW